VLQLAAAEELKEWDRRAVHVALLGWTTLARYRPQREWQERRRSLVLHGSARPGPELNYALVLANQPVERVLGECGQFYGAGARHSVVVDAEACPGVDEALRGRGWVLDEKEPAMALGPLPVAAVSSAPAELRIRRVESDADFAAFFGVSRGGRLYVPSLEAALDPDVALLLGAVGGSVVATSRVTRIADADEGAPAFAVADISGVTTLPEFRRRGYGTAMTWAAVAEGERRGASAAVLGASEMGAPVYRRMGFRHAGTYRTYLPPDN
jgi:ribosomal protein S18 acetylase RimI-like enzyme